VCGKPLDFETATKVIKHPTSAATSNTRIGLPINGYKRSIALTAQVTALNRNPTVDYQLYDVAGDPVNVDFGAGTYPQFVFRAQRELAMTTGHRVCVALMAHYLFAMFMSNRADNARITPNMIVTQLAREFVLEISAKRCLTRSESWIGILYTDRAVYLIRAGLIEALISNLPGPSLLR
jgi:hypothetical protein